MIAFFKRLKGCHNDAEEKLFAFTAQAEGNGFKCSKTDLN